ncbi:MAG: flagellar basal body L-ring protein FlgH [Woeseiaceae bacterium]|nr:flagellar basal body L-ring protein FlgH [Woeseiaceae bacterium]
MIRPEQLIRMAAAAGMFALVTGCSTLGGNEPSYAPVPPGTQVYEPATAGAIYRANTDLRLFEDLKASRVGDILTVRLVERTNASKNSATSTSKSTETSLANPTVFGRPTTKDGTPLFEGALAGDQAFDGTGSSSQSNSLVGDITVTVVERQPNGNLRIRGEKWVTLNQGEEFIQLAGIVRPTDIEPDNTVASTRIADARITYSSKGVMAAANRMGWISRFFHSALSPY